MYVFAQSFSALVLRAALIHRKRSPFPDGEGYFFLTQVSTQPKFFLVRRCCSRLLP